jgi:hypothetical protein
MPDANCKVVFDNDLGKRILLDFFENGRDFVDALLLLHTQPLRNYPPNVNSSVE